MVRRKTDEEDVHDWCCSMKVDAYRNVPFALRSGNQRLKSRHTASFQLRLMVSILISSTHVAKTVLNTSKAHNNLTKSMNEVES